MRVRNDKKEGPYLILSASALAAPLNVAVSRPRLESGCFADDRCALAARESGGGRYPRHLCSSDMMMRASLTPTLSRSMLSVVPKIRFASSMAATFNTSGLIVIVGAVMSFASLKLTGFSISAATTDLSTSGTSPSSGFDLDSLSVAQRQNVRSSTSLIPPRPPSPLGMTYEVPWRTLRQSGANDDILVAPLSDNTMSALIGGSGVFGVRWEGHGP